MDFEKCLLERRSIRKYIDQKIPNEVLFELVDLAKYSPSWKNSQTVRYHFIKNKAIKEYLANNCVLDFEYNAKTIKRCDTLVVITTIKNVCGYESDGSFSTSKKDSWEMFDAGIASQSFCLAAHNKNIGSVILGIFDDKKIHQYLNLPQDEKVTNLIALGYYQLEDKKAAMRKETKDLFTIIE